jgi:hypothetical protein
VPELAGLLHDFGARWQIQRMTSPAGFVAVRRPEPSVMEVHCARDVEELRTKLEAADKETRCP